MNAATHDVGAGTDERRSRLAAALAAVQPGHSLPQSFYCDPHIFELDLERMLRRHWLCAGHVSSVASPGDFFLIELGRESVIIVRDRAGAVHALVNVCRHRGSRVCIARAGTAEGEGFTCPYHGWSYGLDGHLRVAREMPADFDRSGAGLRALPVRLAHGLIFVSLTDEPPDFSDALAALDTCAGPHGWATARVAARETFEIRANWKLAVENYMECYHCQPAHRDFARRHLYARPASQVAALEAQARARSVALGIHIEDRDGYGLRARPGQESVAVLRSALTAGHRSASSDGAPVAPLMGAFRDWDGCSTYFDVGPLSDFLAYPDHGLVYRFVPRAVDRTEMEVIWLVRAEAVAGRDYDPERLTWLWKVTSAEDKAIIERNQEGVSSSFYRPGRYSLQEEYTQRFTEWYLAEVAR